ncbi:minor tail protein [Mycobacterium phage Fowlmouth]|uniref:Minor tail protein n=1 Tax=Mycobacterium phage Fowlmouth TaxID=2419978 RepID=A0A3G2KG64_9CAUD|nr:minor tail protein [Mycobacterium phage Fowlmouth]AYN57976.1 hypothetical protein SEA_FOWLMOUTH_26 [Mycobacterium phage Fowlmouth]
MTTEVGWWAEVFALLEAEAKKARAQMNGQNALAGSIQTDLSPAISSFEGYLRPEGEIEAIAAKPIAEVSGYQRPSGSVEVTLQKLIAEMSGKQSSNGALISQIQLPQASLTAKQIQRGSIGVALEKAKAELEGSQAQRGSVSAILRKAVASFNGQSVSANPVTFDTIGAFGGDTTGAPSCSINPSTGSTVFVLVALGSGSLLTATYAGSTPMRLLGRAVFNGATLSVFVLRNVVGGSPVTITTTKTGFSWGEAIAISYKNVEDIRPPKTVVGSGTSCAQAVGALPSGLTLQAFSTGASNTNFTSVTGGTNRATDTSSFARTTVNEASSPLTVSAAFASSQAWGGIEIQMSSAIRSNPYLRNIASPSTRNAGSTTVSVSAEVNDWIFLDIHQDRSGFPSSVTLDGVAMVLVEEQLFSNGSATAWIRRYRSATKVSSAGTKTASITSTGSGWWVPIIYAIPKVGSYTTVKATGTSSNPTHAITCGVDDFIIQSFAMQNLPVSSYAGANVYDGMGASQAPVFVQIADESTTFQVSGTVNWASIATVFSP